jgi:hypothetical protein
MDYTMAAADHVIPELKLGIRSWRTKVTLGHPSRKSFFPQPAAATVAPNLTVNRQLLAPPRFSASEACSGQQQGFGNGASSAELQRSPAAAAGAGGIG